MRQNLDKLWAEIFPRNGPGPAIRPDDVRRRVHAALDAGAPERKKPMKKRTVRTAAVCAAVLIALAGTALAAYRHYTALQYFQGETVLLEPAVQTLDQTLEDGSYRVHVDSVLAGSSSTVVGLTVEALTDEAEKELNSHEFFPTRLVGFQPEHRDQYGISLTYTSGHPADSSRIRSFSIRLNGVGAPNTLRVYLRKEGPETGFTLALDQPLESLAVRPDADLEGREFVIRSCTLNAMECAIEVQFAAPFTGGEIVACYFRMADGSLKTLPQLKGTGCAFTSAVLLEDGERPHVYRYSTAFRSPIDPLTVRGVVLNGVEYDFLDPDYAEPAEIPETMQPFLTPFVERDAGFCFSAGDVCGHIGAALEREGDAFTIRYLDKTLTVTPGSAAARLNGAELELAFPPILEGEILLLPGEAAGLLGLDCEMYDPGDSGTVQAPDNWLMTP